MLTCKFCGQEVNKEDKFCSFCGAPLNEQTIAVEDKTEAGKNDKNKPTFAQTDLYEKSATQSPDISNQNQAATNSKFSAFSIAGFVVSLIGILCFAIICGPIGLILSGIGLNETKIKRGKGLAIAGLVVGVLDVLAFFLLL